MICLFVSSRGSEGCAIDTGTVISTPRSPAVVGETRSVLRPDRTQNPSRFAADPAASPMRRAALYRLLAPQLRRRVNDYGVFLEGSELSARSRNPFDQQLIAISWQASTRLLPILWREIASLHKYGGVWTSPGRASDCGRRGRRSPRPADDWASARTPSSRCQANRRSERPPTPNSRSGTAVRGGDEEVSYVVTVAHGSLAATLFWTLPVQAADDVTDLLVQVKKQLEQSRWRTAPDGAK